MVLVDQIFQPERDAAEQLLYDPFTTVFYDLCVLRYIIVKNLLDYIHHNK